MAGIKKTHAYIHTLPFAMDCLGHDEDSWATLLKARGNDKVKFRNCLTINSLCTWDRTPEGHDFWYVLYTLENNGRLNGRVSFL